jgi:hypothetical protein
MIRIVDKTLIITTKQTPVTGDWMCTLQSGFITRNTNEVVIPRKRFISEHKGDVVSRLNAMSKGTEKIVFKLSFKRK